MKRKSNHTGFQGFVLLESSISLGILCIVMLSILPIIVQLKEQTMKWEQNTDAARLCYESSQVLLNQTDNFSTTIQNDDKDYHVQGSMNDNEKAIIIISLDSTGKKWVIYEK